MVSGPHSYYELSFHLPIKKTQSIFRVRDFFIKNGVPESEIVQSVFKSKEIVSCFTSSGVFCSQMKKKAAVAFPDIPFHQSHLKRSDWFDKWVRYFRRQKIGKRFLVIPSREKNPSDQKSSRLIIYLDPAGAFGSGSHETTRLVLALMEHSKRRWRSFLDIGTGSGILSIAAYRLNPKALVTAIDSDPVSTLAARRNFKMNEMRSFTLLTQDLDHWKARRKFDLIAANLTSAELQQSQESIARRLKLSGILIVSGILRRNFQNFLSEFRSRSLRLLKKYPGRQWSAALYEKI